MFQGFCEQTLEFLWGVRLNNQRPWFLEHKQAYLDYLYQPLKEMGAEVQERMLALHKNSPLNLHVSRIYRDARRLHGKGPYKDHLWFTLYPPTEHWARNSPAFYFGVSPEGYSYGMGYYDPRPALMAAYRQHILDKPEPLEKLVRRYNRQSQFVLEGEEYKRPKGAVSPLLTPWFNRKSLDLYAFCPADETLFSAELVDVVVEGFQWLWPYYRYLKDIPMPIDFSAN